MIKGMRWEAVERKVSLPRTRAKRARLGRGLCEAAAVAGLSRQARPTAARSPSLPGHGETASPTALRRSGPQRQGTGPS